MDLFTILTILTFVNSFAPRIVSVLSLLVPRNKSIDAISTEIIELKRQLSLISMVDEFARHARLLRKIGKLQDEKKKLVEEASRRIATIKLIILSALHGIASMSLLIMVNVYRGEILTKLPPEWLWPVPRIFDWFEEVPGCISISSWIIMSSTAFTVISKSL